MKQDSIITHRPLVDIIIPCYMESHENLKKTINGALTQSLQPQNIFLVDDGSPTPVHLPEEIAARKYVKILRQNNQGISSARNNAAGLSTTEYILFLNCEIVLDTEWLRIACAYMEANSMIGAACGSVYPEQKRFLLTSWRMRFQENYEERGVVSKEIKFATGHAVLVRRAAFEKIDGYDVRFQRTHEDADLCRRLRFLGYSTHYVAGVKAFSIQADTLKLLAQKTIRMGEWSLDPNLKDDATLRPIVLYQSLRSVTNSFLNRILRNLYKLRLHFIPVDIAVWLTSILLLFQWQIRYGRLKSGQV